MDIEKRDFELKGANFNTLTAQIKHQNLASAHNAIRYGEKVLYYWPQDDKESKPPTEIGYSLSMVEFVDETLARAVLEMDYGNIATYLHSNLNRRNKGYNSYRTILLI